MNSENQRVINNQTKFFNHLAVAIALMAFLTIPMGMWGQGNYSTDYTGNVTLSTSGGTSASICKVTISNVEYAGIKAGTGSASGAVKITVPAGTKHLHMHFAGWNNENVTLSVTPSGYSSNIALTSNSGISNSTPFTFSGDPSTSDYYKVITFSSALNSDTNLTFSATSGKRFVVWGVTAEEDSGGGTPTTYNVTVNQTTGGTITATPTQAAAGETIALTATPDLNYSFDQWIINPTSVTVNNNQFIMPSSDVTVSAQWTQNGGGTPQGGTDVLTYSTIGVTGTSYNVWSGKEGVSGAVYAGQSSGNSNTIQLRATSPSGIVSTTSGGKLSKVTLTWTSSTATDRTVDVYGKNTAYTGSVDLYSTTDQGTKIGSIVKGTSTELTIEGDYDYVGLRSASGSLNLDKIEITWVAPSNVAIPTFSPEGGIFATAQNVTITCETEGATIYYTTDGTTPTNESTAYTGGAINVTETTTIKAIAYKNNEASLVASATYTIVTPYTTIPQIYAKAQEVGSTQTDIYVTFDNWTVVGKSYSNAYVTDGQYGLNIYGSGSGFAIGDQLSGTVACKVMLYTQGAELVNLSTTTPGLTVTHGNSFEPYAISLADLTGQGIYFGSYVDLGNLTYSDSKFNDGNGNVINPNNTFAITGYPTLTEGKTYRVKGVYIRYNSTTERIAPVYASDFNEVVAPMLSIDPTTAAPFTYVEGNGPSDDQMFEVTGTNLASTDIVATITTGAEYFEITDDETYSSTVTVNSGDIISIRLKAGLALGNYAGTLTLTNEGAENVVVALSGSVTGQTYSIVLDDQVVNGTIAADMASAPADATVTLTATPDAGYEFGEWTVLDEDLEEVTVTSDQFNMPASDVLVSATFTAKPTYAINCIVSPNDAALMEASPASAYEGQTVTLSYTAETGYTLSTIVVTKTSDSSATDITPVASGDDFTFTMPDFAVTVTATFISDTYTGNFVLFTEEMTEGDYILVYDGKAMTNTVTSNKFDVTDVTPSGSIITDPSRNIVWHIAPSATTGYWTIKNEKVNKYANSSTATSTNVSLVDTPYDGAKWIASGTDTHDFRPKINEGQSTVRYLRKDARFGAYAASNGGPLTLYKYTVLTERTITFNGNGGTYNEGGTYTQTVYDGIAANLDANKFTKENSAFAGWSTTQNGEVEYADGASITVSSDLTLYAQWATSYTAMVDDQIVGGTVLVNNEEIVEVAAGTEITLTYTANPGYAFSAWNVYKDGDETTTVTVTDDKFTMPEYDVIVSASFVEVTTYSLVTNVNQIVSGKHYIIAGNKDSNWKAMGSQTNNNRTAVDVTVAENRIAETSGVFEFVINGPNTENYTIYDVTNGGYLYAAGSGSGNNHLRNQATNDGNGLWSFNIDNETGAAVVVAQGDKTNNYMRFNNSLFSCYASNSSVNNPVYLFVKDNDKDYEYYGCEVTYNETSIEGSITVGAGSVMTITNNEFSNDDPAKLIIEDGGKLINYSTGVQATVEKDITGAGDDNWTAASGAAGWYFIASPVDDADFSTAATGDYDLYMLDWANKLWLNQEKPENSSLFVNGFQRGTGYLYASRTGKTISVAGEIQPLSSSEHNATVTLATDGWNLIGNPLTCKATVSCGFDELNNAASVTSKTSGNAINPFQGIAVFGEAGDMVTFTKAESQTAAAPGSSALQMTVAQNVVTRGNTASTIVDNAVISFNEGSVLPKFTMFESNTRLYIPQDGKEYAIVSSEAQGEMPVNFKAAVDGSYTISVATEGIEANYLHLIDNITGMDVDLLQTPSYTFNARKNDYASRFRLVFSANNAENGNDSFAFISNGQIILTNVDNNATVQVIDALGRMIVNTNANNHVYTDNMAPGVYVLRLVNGNDVKTQKIVVK